MSSTRESDPPAPVPRATADPVAAAATDPTGRFIGRVGAYALHRPSFPAELVSRLVRDALEQRDVADVGSGTGIFSAQIAPSVRSLICIEPNAEMRDRSRLQLSGLNNARIVEGRAEATGLPASSVDAVTAAQAFHWFDREAAGREFRRILRPGGIVALLWYVRQTTGDPFLEEYERMLLDHSLDYREVDHRRMTAEVIADFFRPVRPARIDVPFTERLDLDGIQGRLRSSSYTPPEGHPGHGAMMEAAAELFRKYEDAGSVEFRYMATAWVAELRER